MYLKILNSLFLQTQILLGNEPFHLTATSKLNRYLNGSAQGTVSICALCRGKEGYKRSPEKQ